MTLLNTSNITSWQDIRTHATAIDGWLDCNNLPSYAYPEVYEFFVVQKGLELYREEDGTKYFDFGENFEHCSNDELMEFNKNVRLLESAGGLFFQRKNAGVVEAERAVRQAEHELAKAEIKLREVLEASALVVE